MMPKNYVQAHKVFLHALIGMVQVYGATSADLWWFMLTAALFWKIWFPLDAKMREAKHQVKYIHLGCGLAGLLIPFIPVIANMASFAQRAKSDPSIDFVSGGLGFTSIRSPPLTCNGNSKAIVFYATILPSNLLLAAGTTLTLLIFWLVHRVSILFRYLHLHYALFHSNTSSLKQINSKTLSVLVLQKENY